ncbi:tetratricopeptide repeat protein [Sulfurospirillum cavolei]|uniref:tetratricopeptide repeat protein n=2 Tax=Sulfurospirillum cavolei TaxID=366522 RepID=UPI000764A438|nr:tetratricopeptide repeat protein [Sulfurospirillum cavolei]
MKKQILLYSLALLPVVVLASEPSAFGSYDSSSSPSSTSSSSVNNSTYSITSSDVVTPSNTQKTEKTAPTPSSSKSTAVFSGNNNANNAEQYEILRSVMDSYETKIAKQDERIRKLEEENQKLQGIKEYVEESRRIQNENQEKIKTVVSELGSLIDSINKNYVPKEKFDQLANEVHGNKSSSKVTPAANESSKKETSNDAAAAVSAKALAGKDSATLLKEADDLYAKKSYNDAQTYYKELLNRNYKPAKVNFTLGEIAYTQKAYSGAIEYYKASIALHDKAAYIPTLLYHTGSSFDKLGKGKEAQSFYKALKENYPTSPEAKSVK